MHPRVQEHYPNGNMEELHHFRAPDQINDPDDRRFHRTDSMLGLAPPAQPAHDQPAEKPSPVLAASLAANVGKAAKSAAARSFNLSEFGGEDEVDEDADSAAE